MYDRFNLRDFRTFVLSPAVPAYAPQSLTMYITLTRFSEKVEYDSRYCSLHTYSLSLSLSNV
jgi:hypothetical protein